MFRRTLSFPYDQDAADRAEAERASYEDDPRVTRVSMRLLPFMVGLVGEQAAPDAALDAAIMAVREIDRS